MKKILIINGSLGDDSGNTQFLIDHLNVLLQSKARVEILNLGSFFKNHDPKNYVALLSSKLTAAQAFVFSTGTYWDSWGSPMQMFLEIITEFEASDVLFSKPAAVLVTMHSVGGKGVLSRLQGVLNTLGLLIPPMSGLVYSLAGKLAYDQANSFNDDFWSLKDLEIIAHNLLAALEIKASFISWPVDHADPKRIWIK